MPLLSVIVPAYGQPDLLSLCLQSLRASTFTDYELLVADDGSPDVATIRNVVDQFHATLIRCPERRGSAAARNRAAKIATGDLLVFIDSDCTARPDTLARLAAAFDRDLHPDAVIGSYDRNPSGPTILSQFRNLLHAHAHQRSHGETTTFWTGCGAIRRSRFESLGGFQESFHRPSIEDVELGLRLHRAGGRIAVDPEIQVTHHKIWTLYSMLRTDLVARAIPWAALIRDHGLPRNLNFRAGDRLGAAFAALAVPLLLIAILHGSIYWALFALAIAGAALCQASILRFIANAKGVAFTVASFPFLLLYNLTCVVGLLVGMFYSEARRDRWFVPALAASFCAILGLQIAGGAYRAEFNAYPDEPAQFVSGLMIYDYATQLPHQSPLTWAEKYYLHYPEIAIGRWPPGFHLMEAAWWLVLPPSRASAMLLNALLLFLAAAIFYRLARSLAPGWVALPATLLLITTPVVQESVRESMADLPCLLWAVLFIDALVRLLRRPSSASACVAGLWLVCAALTKGTAACLLLAPVIALVIAGHWRALFRRRLLLTGAAIAVLAGIWYLIEATSLHQNMFFVGALLQVHRDAIPLVASLAGLGFALLALAGFWPAITQRHLTAIASAAVIVSTVATATFIGAMNEPRHFILVIPALFLLAIVFLAWLSEFHKAAYVLAVPALLVFPAQPPRMHADGFASLRRQIPHPQRMLVSSNEFGEGPWVAEVALTEKRPSSTVVRASKILAQSSWSGFGYQLLTNTPAEVAYRLDELRIGTVIVHTRAGRGLPPHQALLQQALADREAWRPCASSQSETPGVSLEAFCRLKPPQVPPRPLQIDLHDYIGRSVQEPD